MNTLTALTAVKVLTVSTPMQAIFTQAIGLVLAENQRVLQAITYPAIEQLAQKITDVERIFVIGEGRSGLAIRMAAMRLMFSESMLA